MQDRRWERGQTRHALRVLHVFSDDLWAGAERMVVSLLRRLHETGVAQPIALTLNDGQATHALRRMEVETHVIPESRNSFPRLLATAYRIFRNREIHVIHSHRYKENLLAAMLRKVLGAPALLATVHGCWEHAPCDNNYWSGLKTSLNGHLFRRHFDRVIAVSEDCKRSLTRDCNVNEARLRVIHNGIRVSETERTAVPSKHDVHVGSVGRFVEVKGFDLFVRMASEMGLQRRDVRFSLLGEGPLKSRLMNDTRALGIEGRFSFEAPRSNPESYYKSLDVYVNTSWSEGSPLSVFEAMAEGIPVVAPKVGGLPEIIEDGLSGFLAKTRDPKEFARICLELARDEQLRSVVGARGKERVRSRFSDSRMAAAYMSEYLDITGNAKVCRSAQNESLQSGAS